MGEAMLEFEAVCDVPTFGHFAAIRNMTFCVNATEMLLVHLESEGEHPPIVDLALGLRLPGHGTTRFDGRTWKEMGPFEAASNRGRIGCVFQNPGWISSLTVAENVMLRERHHGRRRNDEIRAEADALAVKLGAEPLPDKRPHRVRKRMLRLYEWVRACLGHPALLVLECPEDGVGDDALDAFVDVVNAAAVGGAAVVWLTDSETVWRHQCLKHAARAVIEQEQWKWEGCREK